MKVKRENAYGFTIHLLTCSPSSHSSNQSSFLTTPPAVLVAVFFFFLFLACSSSVSACFTPRVTVGIPRGSISGPSSSSIRMNNPLGLNWLKGIMVTPSGGSGKGGNVSQGASTGGAGRVAGAGSVVEDVAWS